MGRYWFPRLFIALTYEKIEFRRYQPLKEKRTERFPRNCKGRVKCRTPKFSRSENGFEQLFFRTRTAGCFHTDNSDEILIFETMV